MEDKPIPTPEDRSARDLFELRGRVVVITGGAGFLGQRHAAAVAEMGGTPVLLDVDAERAVAAAQRIGREHGVPAHGLTCDVSRPDSVEEALAVVLDKAGRVDALINNAANNPKVEDGGTGTQWSRFENLPMEVWRDDIAIGLTGAYLCSRTFGAEIARRGGGAILNIASDLGIIGPDQRIYRKDGIPEEQQPVKPVTYSVVKAGLIGLTRYCATYWADRGVRCNAILPGGIFAGQDEVFLSKLTNLIPLGRMARADEYKAAVVFMISEASSYMTGALVSIDGGRTCW